MKKRRINPVRILLGVILVPVMWFYIVPYFMLIGSPFSWRELNQNGFLSPARADYYASYGIIEYPEDGMNCKEYFAQKDGRPLKNVCAPK